MAGVLLWAVDAFETNDEILQSGVRALELIAPRLGSAIQPIYILTPSQLNLATEFSELAEAPTAGSYRPLAERNFTELLKDVGLQGLRKPKVLSVESVSTQAAVEALSSFAGGIGAEAIVVSSHGRRGLGRFFLGSFAETLMAQSKVPVIVVHPGAHVSSGKSFKRLLVPTDLMTESYSYYEAALDLARNLKLDVTLLHCIEYPAEPVIQSAAYLLGGGWLPVHPFLSDELADRQKRIEHWVHEGERQGVKVKAMMDGGAGSLADVILRFSIQEKANMIAMAVQSGPITSALLGSVTREVVRRAPCPVWVLRLPARKQPRKKTQAAA